ncbi:MAG: sulfate ABC transporter permease subunit [Chloroflexota bacterium]|nr:sulfate ABC transporter permease subunit [Chloroflexota bacterium]
MRELRPRSAGAFLLIALVLGYAFVLVLAPIGAIIGGTLERGFAPVLDALDDPNLSHALQLTFILSISATTLNVVFGVIVSWVLERQRFMGRRLLNLLVDLPFVFSPVIAGFTLIVLFGRGGWIDPPFAIVFALPGMLLAKMFVCLPFVPREVSPVLATLSPEPEQAAYTLGASRWTTFRRIVLPSIWVGVVYGAVLTLARALGEFGAVAVVSGGLEGITETATIYIYRALSDRNRVGAYTVSLLLGGIAVLLLVVMTWLQARMNVNRERRAYVHSIE